MAVASDVLLQNPSPVPLGEEAVFNAISSSEVPNSATFRSSQLLVPAITVNNNTIITFLTCDWEENTTQLHIYG